MSRAPAFPPKLFHRIKFSSDQNLLEGELRKLDTMIQNRSTSMVSADLALRFKKGNGLVVASWNRWDEASRAEVKALGVVIEIGAADERKVNWVRVYPEKCELPRSYRPGKEKWDNPTVQLDPSVAEDFRLKELFERYKDRLIASTPNKSLG